MQTKSIGRDIELARVQNRLASFREGKTARLHFAVSCPPKGGLSTFLRDVAGIADKAGDFVQLAVMTDSQQLDQAFQEFANALAHAVGETDGVSDGDLNTIFELLERFSQSHPGRIAVLILDVSAALRAIANDPQRAGDKARSDPLLRRLRNLANVLADKGGPLAVIVGWDDRFPQWAPSAKADDVVQRYTPTEPLFSDFGLGRKGWPLYRAVLEASGLSCDGDYPGFCGSPFPPGAVVAAAALEDRHQVDGRFLLKFLLESLDDQRRRSLETLDPGFVIDLCLRDRIFEAPPIVGSNVQLLPEGGYSASTELYRLLGLVAPREIVSFDDSIKHRLEEREPTLRTVLLEALAKTLAGSDVTSATYGRVCRVRHDLIPLPLEGLEVHLIVTLQGQLDEGELAEALTYALTVERSLATAASHLLIVAHSEPQLAAPLNRILVQRFADEGIQSPRPMDVEVSATGQRLLAGVMTLSLPEADVIALARSAQDPAFDSGFPKTLGERLTGHYRSVLGKMPALTPDVFTGDRIARLIQAQSGSAKLEGSARELLRVGIAEQTDEGFSWRWSKDEFLQLIGSNNPADQGLLAQHYLFDPSSWSAIGIAAHQAYTSDLLKWDGSKLSAVDPSALLKELLKRIDQRLEGLIEELPASTTSDWVSRRTQAMARANSATAIEQSRDELYEIERDVQRYKQEEAQRRAAASSERDSLLAQIDALGELPPDLGSRREQLGSLDDVLLAISQAKALMFECQRRRHQEEQRQKTLRTLRQEIKETSNEASEEGKRELEKLVADPNVPAERVVGKMTELKLKSSAKRAAPAASPESPTRTETFKPSDEDLARLADLYSRVDIRSVEIEE
jgi:hypothetical protein